MKQTNELSFEQVLASRIINELAKPRNERKTLSEQTAPVKKLWGENCCVYCGSTQNLKRWKIGDTETPLICGECGSDDPADYHDPTRW